MVKTRQLLALRNLPCKVLRGTVQVRHVLVCQVTNWVDLDRSDLEPCFKTEMSLLDLEKWLSFIYQSSGRLHPAGFTNFESPQMWEWEDDPNWQYRFKPARQQ
jgi:hypothetical protein